MKRKFAFMIVMLLTVLTVTSCGNNGLADYKKAVDKTDQIERGQSSSEFSLSMDLNTEGMTQEEINELNYYKDITGNFQTVFDSSTNQTISRNYLNLGGLGFDFDLYKNGDEMFVKLPIIGKYMKMDDIMKKAGEEVNTEKKTELISEDSLDALTKEWVGVMKEENVFRGKDIVLTTPDGEVKTTIYTITLNDDQIKILARNSIDVLAKDEKLKSNFESMIEKNMDQSKKVSYEEFFSNIKEQMEKDTIESFQYTAYVDIDGYIVNETIDVKVKREALEKGEPKEITYKMELKNWDINKKQKLEFPVLTEDNTMKTDNLDETMPSLFEGLFENNR